MADREARVTLRVATEQDVGAILTRGLRQADVIECERMCGKDIWEAIHYSWGVSTHRYIVERDGLPMALAGCYPRKLLLGIGAPWLVTTEDAPQYWRPFLKFSKVIMEHFKQDYRILTNVVDLDNTASQRWLKWLGFEIDKEKPVLMQDKHPFYRFGMEVK